MRSLIVLDTDVASLLYKDRLPDPLAEQIAGHDLCLTFATVGELAKWPVKASWGRPARVALARWIESMAVLPYDDATAWRWGRLAAHAERRGRRSEANDTWIAACCIAGSLPLATLNVKDYVEFAEHDGLALVAE